MTTAALAIWIATLLVVALVVVPLAVSLLARTLAAARAIERYLSEMREAGAQIAGHTRAVPALDETIGTAVAMAPVAAGIRDKTGAVAEILAARAGTGAS